MLQAAGEQHELPFDPVFAYSIRVALMYAQKGLVSPYGMSRAANISVEEEQKVEAQMKSRRAAAGCRSVRPTGGRTATAGGRCGCGCEGLRGPQPIINVLL
jgi:hypothetical protein